MIQTFKRPIKVTNGDNPGIYFCAGFSRKGTVDSVGLANEMKEGSSSFTKGEVVGVTLDLPARIKQAILDGKAVNIIGLGVFKPSLTVKEVKKDAEELKTSAIRIKGLNFRPDAILLQELNDKAEFQWISADKADKEDKDEEEKKEEGDDTQTPTPTPPSGGDSSSVD